MLKSWSGHAVRTHLTSGGIADAVGLGFSVASTTGWPVSANPFVITVDAGTNTEEKILVASFSGLSVTAQTRGWDGTTAQAHGVGVDGQVIHTIDADFISTTDVFVHSIGTSAPVASALGDTALNGSTGVPADSGHRHAREQFGTDVTANVAGQSTNNGSGTTVAHSNHQHQTPAAYSPPSRAGEVVAFAGATLPTYALWCDGATYLNTAYPTLAGVLGNIWGGDATHFAVPDLRSKALMGSNQNGGSAPALAAGLTTRAVQTNATAFIGVETHVITSGELPTHNHTLGAGHAVMDGHTHSFPSSSILNTAVGGDAFQDHWGGVNQYNFAGITGMTTGGPSSSGGNLSLGGNTDNTGSSTAMSLMQPSVAIGFIIYTI